MARDMEQIEIEWDGPFTIEQEVSKEHFGAVGLYIIEYNSCIIYIGKAETEGAHHRARNHFSGSTDRIGNRIRMNRGEKKLHIWVGIILEERYRNLISTAEQLLIYKLQPTCNKNHRDEYKGEPSLILNKGHRPKELPKKIKSK